MSRIPQIAQKPRRRQRKAVAGWTMIRPHCQFAHQCDNNTQNSRSLGRKHGRRVPVRWDFAAELLLKAAETRKESDVDMATAQMERALRVEGWL